MDCYVDFCRPFSQAQFTCHAERACGSFHFLSLNCSKLLQYPYILTYYCPCSLYSTAAKTLAWHGSHPLIPSLVLLTGLNTVFFYWIKSCFTCIPLPTCPHNLLLNISFCRWQTMSVPVPTCLQAAIFMFFSIFALTI